MNRAADSIDTLVVWWGDQVAGTLALDRGGAMHFTYARQWLDDPRAAPLSQAMPKQAEAFDDRICKAVFGGLLPEEAQRTAIARALGVSADNPFRLLEALGGDVAGALAFLPEGAAPEMPDASTPSEPLDHAALAALLERLPRHPMLAGEGGARLSLAGAQSKLPVVVACCRCWLVGIPVRAWLKISRVRFRGSMWMGWPARVGSGADGCVSWGGD